jgi:hypothetical protein
MWYNNSSISDPESNLVARKTSVVPVAGVLACLLIAAVAYVAARSAIDSLFAYRSPLAQRPPAAGEPLGGALTRRVVFVLIDALRADTALRPAVMPFLAELRVRGASATMRSRPPSYSEPGYTVLLTGAWPDISDGPPINLDYDEIPTWTQDDLFSAASRAGLRTAVSGYYWFEKLIPQRAVSASFYTAGEDEAADRQVAAAALPWLRAGEHQLTLIHIDQVDYAGHHEGGPRDPRWDAAATRADALLRQIAAELDLNRDTLLAVSDHGQIDAGGHGGQDPITLVEPFVLVGAGVRPGQYGDVQMADVAPTLAALLGTSIPASAQGRVLTEMLVLPAGRQGAIERAYAVQQTRLAQAYATAIDQPPVLLEAPDATASQAAFAAARRARLTAERWPRAIMAAVALLVLAGVLYRLRGRALAWMLAAALLYHALFHLRYAFLSGRTYSLSSVLGADELILYSATTALLACLLAWLLLAAGLHLPRRGPGVAARLTIGWTFVVVVSLSLPVLYSLALNGPIVTWTLPDFLSYFVGFLSLLQILFVALLGPLLAGLAALSARLASRPAHPTQ